MEPIAITGFSFRLPQGAEDEDTFWDLLREGRNVVTEWPESRGTVDTLLNKDRSIKNTVCFSP
jgi:acyl transferase domain-containing protein